MSEEAADVDSKIGRRGFTVSLLGSIASAIIPKSTFAASLNKKKYIIYHVTDSLNRGENQTAKILKRNRSVGAHYLVKRNGRILDLVDENSIARHVGNSRWDNDRNLNSLSIGIENSDNKTGNITLKQYETLRKKIKELRNKYNIPSENVLPHAVVRTFRVNGKWVRGGKTCGMFLDRDKLGLGPIPVGKVNIGIEANPIITSLVQKINLGLTIEESQKLRYDTYVLNKGQTPWSIVGEDYDDPSTIYLFPDKKILAGNEVDDWTKLPQGVRIFENNTREGVFKLTVAPVIILEEGQSPYTLIGPNSLKDVTVYIFSGNVIRGSKLGNNILSPGTIMITNVAGVYNISEKLPYNIVGKDYDLPGKIIYLLPNGEIDYGDKLNPTKIPPNTIFFVRE